MFQSELNSRGGIGNGTGATLIAGNTFQRRGELKHEISKLIG